MFDFAKQGLSPPLIHIGYPRCLSTWLQTALFRPKQGFETIMAPVAVQLQIIDPGPFAFRAEAVEEHLVKRTAKSDSLSERTPVVTSETLSGNMYSGGHNAKELADRLAVLFPTGRVLIVVREQRSMIRALYSIWMHWGMPHSIGRMLEPVNPRTVPQFNLPYLFYDLPVRYYREAFGPNRVAVLFFEQFIESGREFVKSIYEFVEDETDLDVRLNRLPFEDKINPSSCLVNLKIQRCLNRLFASGPCNYGGAFEDTDQAIIRRLRAAARRNSRIPRFMSGWFETGFRRRVEEATQGKFCESNRKLAELTGVDLERYGYEI